MQIHGASINFVILRGLIHTTRLIHCHTTRLHFWSRARKTALYSKEKKNRLTLSNEISHIAAALGLNHKVSETNIFR